MEYTIGNGVLTLTAGEDGGLLRAVTKPDGQELLWGGDPSIWGGRAPVCFPWCGNIKDGWYEEDGVRHEAPTRHGFVRDFPHKLVGRGIDTLTFRFRHDGSEPWPWPFTFETIHALEGKRVYTTCTARNRGETPMPVQLGFHPAFRVPFVPGTDVEDYVFHFASGKEIPLKRDLFDNDSFPVDNTGAWCRLEHRASGKYIQVTTAGFYTTLLWSKPGVPGFVCIEPWDGFTGESHDLAQRPGTVLLQPGKSRTWQLEMDFEV